VLARFPYLHPFLRLVGGEAVARFCNRKALTVLGELSLVSYRILPARALRGWYITDEAVTVAGATTDPAAG
jgi:hypothetical protein